MPDFMRADARGVRVVKDTDLSGIRAATPDVILATKERQGSEYTDLSKIAPTILTEGDDWKLNLREHGEALGRTNDSEELLTDWDNRLARVKRALGEREDVGLLLAGRAPAVSGPVGEMVLEDLGIEDRRRRSEVIRIDAGPEWVGAGGLLAARAALEDVAKSPLAVRPAPLGEHPHLADDKRGSMSTQLLDALSRLAARRFGSFADAATQVFDLLESACPGGNLVLGQVDWDEGKCRVIDARGDGVPRGAVIPLARGVPVNGSAAGGAARHQRARGARARRTGSRRPWTRPTAASSDCCSPPGRAVRRRRATSPS